MVAKSNALVVQKWWNLKKVVHKNAFFEPGAAFDHGGPKLCVDDSESYLELGRLDKIVDR